MSQSATSLIANSRGEIKGFGPKWSCTEFADEGHNYHTCPGCMFRYMTWLADNCRRGESA